MSLIFSPTDPNKACDLCNEKLKFITVVVDKKETHLCGSCYYTKNIYTCKKCKTPNSARMNLSYFSGICDDCTSVIFRKRDELRTQLPELFQEFKKKFILF